MEPGALGDEPARIALALAVAVGQHQDAGRVEPPVGAVDGVAVDGDAQPRRRPAEGVHGPRYLPGHHHEGAAELDAVQGELGDRPQLVEEPDQGGRLGERLAGRHRQRLRLTGERGPVEVPVTFRQ